MNIATIPPMQRKDAIEKELRKFFPSACKDAVALGLFVVAVRYNATQVWVELRDSRTNGLVADYRNFNVTAGLEAARDHIEQKCRETLVMIMVHPDKQEG